MEQPYVHGYDPRENIRLQDQATTLTELLHIDTRFPSGSRVLEVGCGVGAQTVPLAQNSPDAAITAVDIAEASIRSARQRVEKAGITNVAFQQCDIFEPCYAPAAFDHVFVCFVLEHLSQPVAALQRLATILRPGGSITVIEGDHGSVYFYPESEAARAAIACQVALQSASGGNALIGRELYPLLDRAGFHQIRVSPRMVYADNSKPELVDGFIRKTFTAMIEGVRDKALNAGLIDADNFDQGIRDLYRTTHVDGVFCYTFFKAIARKSEPQ
jgi:SAM-dependent methyltransferase